MSSAEVLAALDLAAQAPNLHVDRAVVDLVVVQAREPEDLVAREHALGRGEESSQEIELAVGERDVRAAGAERRRKRTLSSNPAKR